MHALWRTAQVQRLGNFRTPAQAPFRITKRGEHNTLRLRTRNVYLAGIAMIIVLLVSCIAAHERSIS